MEENVYQKRLTPKDRQIRYFRRILFVSYAGFLFLILFGCLHLKSIYTHSEVYNTFYKSRYLQVSKLLYFFILLISGYLYTSSVVLRHKDKELREKGEWKLNLVAYCGYGLALYFIAPNITIMGMKDDNSIIDLLLFNYFGFTVPYMITLHFSYLEKGIFKDISLEWDSIKY